MTEGSDSTDDMTAAARALPDGSAEFLGGLKARVKAAQLRAQRVVDTEPIELYWQIGNGMLTRQENQVWGSGVVCRLGEDIGAEFPRMTNSAIWNSIAAGPDCSSKSSPSGMRTTLLRSSPASLSLAGPRPSPTRGSAPRSWTA